jgi:HEAT repeat protein
VAILVISEAGRHRDRAVDVLVELFRNLPADRAPDRNDLVYSIANIGNERAVDFLTDLAINEPDIDLRSTAIYCLGGIGGEKARTALTRILKAR